MTPLLSRLNAATNFYSTSTPLTHILNSPRETPNTEDSILFLHTLVSPGPDNTLLTTVYSKPIHTDHYLHWDSHHNMSAKYRMFKTLTHRARTVSANLLLLHMEEEHIRDALTRCNYPTWALNRLKTKNNHKYSNTGPHQFQGQ